MTAQTKENASALIKDKYAEVMRHFPLLQSETIEKKNRFADNLSEVYWNSGAKLSSLANSNSSKGQRRKRIVIEESALLNNELFQDCLEPIANIPRRTIGPRAIVNPLELNGQINFVTTSAYRGSDEHMRNITYAEDMIELRKGRFLLGASYILAAKMGRGETIASILTKKESLSPSAFDMNYMSRWVGSTDGALVSINKVMDLRTLNKAEFAHNGKDEYIISVDVARSEKKENNQSSICILRMVKNKKGKLVNVDLVNVINIPAVVNFETQALTIMRLKNFYNAKAVIVDSNGLGEKLPLIVETLCRKFGEPTNVGCVA